VRSEEDVRDVIERDCDRSESDVGFEGVDESTRNAARRRQILPEDHVSCWADSIKMLTYILVGVVETDADSE